MKKVAVFAMTVGLMSALSAHASCEDGQSMAEDAAITLSQKTASGCKIVNDSIQLPDRNGKERWKVTVGCSSFNGANTYLIQLQPMEDAVCFFSSIKVLETLE